MSNLDIAIRKQVPTVPQALKALAAMELQLTAAKTYEDLRRVIKEASALKVLMNDVAEVKAAAENAILLGNKRIAEELRKVPKAGGPGRGKRLPPQGKSLSGKAATGIKHSTPAERCKCRRVVGVLRRSGRRQQGRRQQERHRESAIQDHSTPPRVSTGDFRSSQTRWMRQGLWITFTGP